MDPVRAIPYRDAMNTLGTRLSTWLYGRLVGTDPEGNRYYTTHKPRAGTRARRWVLYKAAEPEASLVPPEWHAWLHFTTNEPIPMAARKPWQQPHMPNMTGTAGSYRPPGHDYRGGNRAPATGDYEAWTPGS
jgi:NADH:ubiquinone oxidoreductase subunit